jgi:hypothetical protein
MSDDDDTPGGAEGAVPEAGKGWSEQDRRTLIITIVGTLAANIATVILVGGAIAAARLNKAGQTESAAVLGWLGGAGIGLFIFVVGLVLRRRGRRARERVLPGPSLLLLAGWYAIVLGGVWVLWSVMILVGLAAGVK